MTASASRREGFSLIEALVALAIASMTLMAIFELQIQMTRSQQRAALAIEQVAAQENALALTRNVNPMAQPQGWPGTNQLRRQSSVVTGCRLRTRFHCPGQPFANSTLSPF